MAIEFNEVINGADDWMDTEGSLPDEQMLREGAEQQRRDWNRQTSANPIDEGRETLGFVSARLVYGRQREARRQERERELEMERIVQRARLIRGLRQRGPARRRPAQPSATAQGSSNNSAVLEDGNHTIVQTSTPENGQL